MCLVLIIFLKRKIHSDFSSFLKFCHTKLIIKLDQSNLFTRYLNVLSLFHSYHSPTSNPHYYLSGALWKPQQFLCNFSLSLSIPLLPIFLSLPNRMVAIPEQIPPKYKNPSVEIKFKLLKMIYEALENLVLTTSQHSTYHIQSPSNTACPSPSLSSPLLSPSLLFPTSKLLLLQFVKLMATHVLFLLSPPLTASTWRPLFKFREAVTFSKTLPLSCFSSVRLD